MFNQAAIERIMAETGMGEIQAYRHLRDRKILQRRHGLGGGGGGLKPSARENRFRD